MYLFSTSESVSRNDYIGLGNSSNNILRNTIVVGNRCLATTLVFSIRELANATPYTATLFVNGIATVFDAVIPDGATSFSVSSNNSIQLNQLDLITIHITYSGGALSNGACATLLTTSN